MDNNNLWIGAYYPSSVLTQSRTRTIMCLLFDKIICTFPIADMDCGGGSGVSQFYSDSPLVDEDILELREEFLLDEIERDFTKGFFWGTEKESDRYLELQITKMAINLCDKDNIVPITNNRKMTIPATLIEKNKLLRFAHLQAAALAIQSLEIALPSFENISDDDILEARLKLKEQLMPFRRAMLMMSPLVRSGINNDATLTELYSEAKYIADTKIAPALDEIKDKLYKERGRFWRRLIMKGGVSIPKLAFNWATKGALAASVIGIDDLKNLAVDAIDYESTIETLINKGGMGFLLKVSEYPKFIES